jgi:hypothetical protein
MFIPEVSFGVELESSFNSLPVWSDGIKLELARHSDNGELTSITNLMQMVLSMIAHGVIVLFDGIL